MASVLEGTSQLSFPDNDEDDELRRDFKSRPLLSSRKKKKKKKRRVEMPPSPLEQLLKNQPTSCMEETTKSPRIPVKRKLKSTSKKKKDPARKATNDKDDNERPLRTHEPSCHKKHAKKPPKPNALDGPIPRKRKKKSQLQPSSLEIPYALDFGNKTSKNNNNKKKDNKGSEPLRPGDIIHYNNPLFVAGTKQALTVTQILAIDPSVLDHRQDDQDDDVFPLDLANGQMLPIDTSIIRIKEYRDGELYPHHGICRKIKDFRWIKGKLSGPSGLERRMIAFRSIIAQAQQQLEDEMDQQSRNNKNSSDESERSSDEESDSSSVSSGPIPKMNIPERRSDAIIDGILERKSPERSVTTASQNQTLQLSKAKSFLSQIRSTGKENGSAKRIFDASSDDEVFLKPNRAKAPTQPKGILEDSSSEEEKPSVLKGCTKAQLERRCNSSHSDRSRKKKTSKLSKASRTKHTKSLNEPTLKLRDKVEKTSGLSVATRPEDTTDSDDDEDKLPPSMLRRKSVSSRSTASMALARKRDPPSISVPKPHERYKSFLNASPTEGEEAFHKEEISAEVKKKQKAEIDRLLGVATETSETNRPVKVKHSKTSCFFPQSVEYASSSCNEFANQSSSDEDDESFFRKKKMAKAMKDDGDLSSITTTFTNSQSSTEGKKKRSKYKNSLSSGLKRHYRSSMMELQLQPIPQEDDSF